MNNKRSKSRKHATVNRNYKDTLFRMIFKEPEEHLKLYNAVNGTDYQDPRDLQIVTLENAIYMNMKNDLAFIIDCRMNLYEQQASVNPNMPLRDLIYVAKEYQSMISRKSLYSARLIKLPTPYFVVFYNGTARQPERKEMKLSDSYQTPVEDPALELRVVQLNIGVGHNRELTEKCPLLMQYSQYVGRVQKYALELPLEEAVEWAVRECIREGILSEFLQKNRSEAIAVSIFEYDEEKELALFREAEHELAKEELRDEVKAEVRREMQDEVRREMQDEVRKEMQDEVRNEVRSEVRDEVRSEVRDESLKALIATLQEFCTDPAKIYSAIKKNQIYAELTMDEIRKYL